MEREHGSSPPPAPTLKQAMANLYDTPPPTRAPPKQPAAAEQLESLTRMNLAARTPAPDVATDPILPGIPVSSHRRSSSAASPDVLPAAASLAGPLRASPAIDRAHAEGRRMRTRTLDELSARPPAIPPRQMQRQRVGSMNQALATSSARPSRHDSTSHPISRPGDAQFSPPQRPATTQNGLRDSSRGRGSSRPRSSQKMESDMPVTDPRTMLLLMNKSRGRMRGKVAFTQMHRSSWASAWCSIDVDEGSLLCEAESGSDRHSILVPDLRGCSVTASLDPRSGHPLLNLFTADETVALHLRPLNEAYFNAWFAALLCWHPVQPGQSLDSISLHAPAPLGWLSDRKAAEARSNPQHPATKIIKVGKVMLVDMEQSKPLQKGSHRTRADRNEPRQVSQAKWTPVRIVLAEDGHLRMHSDDNADLLGQIQLSQLSRSAVQRLHPTVIDVECCIAIYPQYSRSADACSCLRPVVLSFEERTVYEAWFVLLRAFTIPEIYGPHNAFASEGIMEAEELPGLPRSASPSLLRIERSLRIRIDKAKLIKNIKKQLNEDEIDEGDSTYQEHETKKRNRHLTYYIDVLVDGQRKAKTSAKDAKYDPYWSESFDFFDLATTVSTVSLQLKTVDEPSREASATSWFHDDEDREKIDERPTSIFETCCGEVLMKISDIDHGNEVDASTPLRDEFGVSIGELSYKIRYREEPILMEAEYQQLEALISNYANALAIQIAEYVPGELTPLALCFLNVYQCSDKAEDWLMALAEEEIDGILKEPPAARSRFTRRLESNESKESLKDAVDREGAVRDLNKHATAEANLLFRANTLASKAIDFHMKRLGRMYLDATIGSSLRHIAMKNTDCEVNPTRVTDKRKLQHNWRRLLKATEDMWERIYTSAAQCPPELRIIFRHIRACANDRYGDFLRTVTYSSVSGFLFLRFFCAAILAPHVFDLLKHEPGTKAMRTYTLIAKSLQGLANMSTFGHKEPWMEPMNKFLNAHRQQFKSFIDTICDVPHSTPLHAKSPSYSTPLQIYGRLKGPTREGFLTLPYHIDRSRNLASLVNLWLNNYNRSMVPSSGHLRALSGDLARFHELCLSLRQRTNACYERVERAERHTSSLTQKWVSIAERMEIAPSEFWIKQRVAVNFSSMPGPTPGTAIPRPSSSSVPNPGYSPAMATAMAAAMASQAKRGNSAERSARSSVDRRRPARSATYSPPSVPLSGAREHPTSEGSDFDGLGSGGSAAGETTQPFDSRPGSVNGPRDPPQMISRASSRTSSETAAEVRRHYTNAERRVKAEETGVRSNSRDRSRLGGLFGRRKRLDKEGVVKEKTRPSTSEK
ncbi:hypothetical protein FH972_024938 [Carpinus fangiana]|uniref:Ras-GAP domain-containing protein n=1 Tax=Carpinus fangiana TaxID=176857 RepID=A0A5N6L0G7_9ROSI|nr:hypothetical protein FH972_024938 [Carpinus fangiana]